MAVFLALTLFVSSSGEDLVKQIEKAMNRAASALIDRQNADGGYGPEFHGKSDVGITALVLAALARVPAKYREYDGPFISAAVDYLLKHQKPDGGIHDGWLWNYKTCMSILALSALDRKKYEPVIKKAAKFVKSLQLCEESPLPYDPKRHVSYGGFGYGSTRRPDLSNTQFALEALHEAGVGPEDPVWKRALVFLSRCQNLCETNDAVKQGLIPDLGTSDDGGFMYRPGESKAGKRRDPQGRWIHSSYGSMTYAGIKSFIYARLDRNDKRVQAAYRWICQHYTVDENPGMASPKDPKRGLQGLYYYYQVMAKALLLWGEPEVPTPKGKRCWAEDLARKLLSLQGPDGLWVNEADRWWEGIPEVSTSYALLALANCREALLKWPPKKRQ